MALYTYDMIETTALLTMGHGENRFNRESVAAFSAILDEIEHQTAATALVVRSGHEKIWCNGIDLDWLLPEIQTSGETAMNRFLADLYRLLKRVLTYPMPTVACIGGHAFGGGAFLSFAHDFRFMRKDRGWICMPEVDLGMTLGPVFMALSKRVLPMPLMEDMQYTARRMDARDCLEYRIVKKACPLESLEQEALSFAQGLKKSRDVIRAMKLETLEPTLSAMDKAIGDLDASS
jgi:Delta3-Delta2-enoyl-CoA isomerase